MLAYTEIVITGKKAKIEAALDVVCDNNRRQDLFTREIFEYESEFYPEFYPAVTGIRREKGSATIWFADFSRHPRLRLYSALEKVLFVPQGLKSSMIFINESTETVGSYKIINGKVNANEVFEGGGRNEDFKKLALEIFGSDWRKYKDLNSYELD
jgi:hypothetical protein